MLKLSSKLSDNRYESDRTSDWIESIDDFQFYGDKVESIFSYRSIFLGIELLHASIFKVLESIFHLLRLTKP